MQQMMIHIPFVDKAARGRRIVAIRAATKFLLGVLDECTEQTEIISYTFQDKSFMYNGTMIKGELPDTLDGDAGRIFTQKAAGMIYRGAGLDSVWYKAGEDAYVITGP